MIRDSVERGLRAARYTRLPARWSPDDVLPKLGRFVLVRFDSEFRCIAPRAVNVVCSFARPELVLNGDVCPRKPALKEFPP
jgi:hypothetical protein